MITTTMIKRWLSSYGDDVVAMLFRSAGYLNIIYLYVYQNIQQKQATDIYWAVSNENMWQYVKICDIGKHHPTLIFS